MKNLAFKNWILNILCKLKILYGGPGAINAYGSGRWLRRYSYYPIFLPLRAYSDHGPAPHVPGEPFKHELENKMRVMFYQNPDSVRAWKEKDPRPCYVRYSPMVFARHSLNIFKNPNAEGSVFFLSHGTKQIKDNNSFEFYLNEINQIPDRYRPVTICLHNNEVKLGADIFFKKNGYATVSAGKGNSPDFAEKFYAIIRNHRYAISNTFGSYAYYAIEMGIPFGLHGSEPVWINHGDENVEKGEFKSTRMADGYKFLSSLFGSLPKDEISFEQREACEYFLGMKHGISRKKMAIVLYGEFIKWAYKYVILISLMAIFLYCYLKLHR